MKYALISDIHGNLEALQKAFEIIDEKKVDSIICLGDSVGYGSNPNECLDIIKPRCEIIVAGNHDYAAINKTDITYFNSYARASAYWTSKKLTKENAEYLDNLPLVVTKEDVTFVHASPINPEEWDYILSIYEAQHQFNGFKNQICFIGHSHLPIIFTNEGEILKDKATLHDKKRYIINVGSIGQPRDGDTRLSFAIYDDTTKYIEIIRAEYDNFTTSKKIKEAGLPPFLGDRLLRGI
jgi:predicted phosphodiesterase